MMSIMTGYVFSVCVVTLLLMYSISSSGNWDAEVEYYNNNMTLFVAYLFILALLWPLFMLVGLIEVEE